MKKPLAFTLAILVLAAPLSALASFTLVSQLISTSETTGIPTAQTIQGLGLLPTGSIESMDLYFNCGSSGTAVARIASYTNSTYSTGVVPYTSDTVNLSSGSAVYTFHFTPISVSPTLYYSIGVQTLTGCTSPKLKGSSDGTSYVDDTTTYKCFSGSCAPVKDLYFSVGSASVDSISFVYPTNGLSTTDFGQWRLDYSFATSSPFAGTIDVLYSRNSSTTNDFDDPLRVASTATSTEIAVLKGEPLLYPPLTEGTEWWTWANLYSANNDLVASTTPFQFSLSYGTEYVNASSTAETPQCTGNGIVGDSFCGAFVYLFWPTQDSLNQFQNLGPQLANKPPFGYITSLNTALNGLSDTASATLDLSPIADLSDPMSGFRTMIAWVFWWLFGFWVFNKFRHFKF